MFSASLSFDTLIIAVEALKEVAQNIGRLVADVKSNKHHYRTSQATKCECSRESSKLNTIVGGSLMTLT